MAKPKIDPEVQLWTERFSAAYGNQVSMFESFKRWYDDFYAVFNQKVAPWRSKIVDPKVASKVLNVLAKVALYNPEPNLRPRGLNDFQKAKNNELLLKYQLDNPEFDTPMFFKRYSVLVDAAVCGVGLALLPYKTTEKKYFSRATREDGSIDYENDKETTVKLGYNEFLPLSIFRVFLEPAATSWHGARWLIIQDFKTDEELEELKEWYGITPNLDDIKKSGKSTSSANTEIYEASRNRLLNTQDPESADKSTKKHELWLCYDKQKNKYTYIVDRKTVIATQNNIYWHGRCPIVPFYIRYRAHNPWGDGLFERTERLGSANNALINHFLDQLDLSLNGMIAAEEDSIIEYDVSPGGMITYSRGTQNKPEQWAIAQPDIPGFVAGRNMLNEAIEENTISQYESGNPRSQMDNTAGTKGGILAIQEAAGDMIRFFKQSYGESCKTWFRMWLSNNQQFLDHEVIVDVLEGKGLIPKTIRPEDIVTQQALHVEVDVDAMESRSRDTERAIKQAWLESQFKIADYAQKYQQPLNINWYEVSRVNAEAMAVPEFEDMVEPMPQANDSPTTENNLLLQGKTFEPNLNEDHETHMAIHAELLADPGIDEEVRLNTETHMALHEEMFAQMKAEQEQAELQALRQQNIETANLAGVTPLVPGAGQPGGPIVQDPSASSPEASPNQPVI